MAQPGTASFYESEGSLDKHIGVLKDVLEESLADPEVTRLAVKIVSGSYDWAEDPRTGRRIPIIQAWGKTFHAPDMAICGPKDDACELGFLWAFVVKNCRYVYDMNSADQFKSIRETLLQGGGDCDDSTIVFCGLARAVGFNHVVARVISTGGDDWEHIYPLIACPKDRPDVWIPLDCTVEGAVPGWEAHYAAARDFDMSGL